MPTLKHLYYLSKTSLELLIPQPARFNEDTQNIPHICFSESIQGCLNKEAVVPGDRFKVYTIVTDNYHIPLLSEVPDKNITEEVWISYAVEPELLYEIEVLNEATTYLEEVNSQLQEHLAWKYKIIEDTSSLTEDTRTLLVAKSRSAGPYKNQMRGKNRFERKKHSQIAKTVKQYNKIDMNKLFKEDILEVAIPVIGETDSYTVNVRMEGIVKEIATNIKNNKNKLEYRTIVQSVTKIFNTANIFVKCSCPDYCLHPDTKIKLLDGTVVTVEELEKKVKTSSTPVYVYSVDDNGDFKPGKVKDVWASGSTTEMLKITLDNGNSVITTPEHPYMLRNGQYKEAKDLEVGTSLMPLYFGTTTNGYETVKANSKATIVNIETINYDFLQPVYDIEVENYHNFYVDAGVILHNCYRFAHWNIVNKVSVDDSSKDPGPGKGIRNPKDNKGRGCKHILLVLANGDWVMKVASVINNYIHYAEKNLQKPFLKLIFPKLYNIPFEDAIEKDVLPDDFKLETSTDIIDVINEYGRNRGKYKPGANKNPVTGTGGKQKATKAEVEKPTPEEPKEVTKKASKPEPKPAMPEEDIEDNDKKDPKSNTPKNSEQDQVDTEKNK